MKKTFYVLNGPNINMLGIREPELYGKESYKALCTKIKEYANKQGVNVKIYQSNHEGDLVDMIQKAYRKGADGIVINPGAYTHTSIAIRDALKACCIPFVEVHISDINSRESYRQISYIEDIAEKSVIGHGINGYLEAIELLLHR